MRRRSALGAALAVLALALTAQPTARAQDIPRFPTRGWFDFAAPRMKDPVLQHAKETFIQYGCAYCHNVDLHPRGEAADLMHSPIVASDTDGSVIAQVLKAGIPQTAKLSPMPQFSDLSEKELADIARWIHYARMEGRFQELMQAKAPARPDPAAGQAYFGQACAACHTAPDLRRTLAAGPRKDAAALRAAVLRPAIVEAPDGFQTSPAARARQLGRDRHRALLENLEERAAGDLVAYLRPPA